MHLFWHSPPGFGSPIDCAGVNAKSKNGNTALDKAVGEGPAGIIDLLRKQGGKTGAGLKVEGK